MRHVPSAAAARPVALLAAVVFAACTGKSESRPDSAAGTGPAGAVNVAGSDSAQDSVVMGSVPPTAQDSSVAVPRGAGTTDTNRSGMAVPSGGAPNQSSQPPRTPR